MTDTDISAEMSDVLLAQYRAGTSRGYWYGILVGVLCGVIVGLVVGATL